MTKQWNRGFAAARAASYLSNAPRAGQRVGAALFCKSNLIAIGCNIWMQNHPFSQEKTFNRFLHAEMKCLLKRRYFDNNSGLILYTYRERYDGTLGCSIPCILCQVQLREADIHRVRCINKDGNFVEIVI